MRNASLLPCPFCGGDDVEVQQHGEGYSWQCWYEVSCFNNYCGSIGKTEAEAIAAWNRRSPAAPEAPHADEPAK
jgi:Lar family restriction alleviation protein